VVHNGKILEKPATKEENLAMLEELNGTEHQVITGVTIVQPQPSHPGYSIHSLIDTTIMKWYDNDRRLLKAYVDSGDGLDKGESDFKIA
jgi:septum formation protein